jgi:hypothetical protein
MCINNNNKIIINNYESLQDLILVLKILLGAQKNFFDVYRDFGHAPSKRFASPSV